MAGPTKADKAALRAQARSQRRGVTRPEQGGDTERWRDGVLVLLAGRGPGTVAAYVSTASEPATSALLPALREQGWRVLLPVVQPDLDLDWATDDGTRSAGVGPGVPEPGGPRLGPAAVAQADVVVVPALLVDRGGRRLGQGGGSYDRALARARPDALVVALLHDGELVDADLPVEPHDRPVDVVVTPTATTWTPHH